MYTICPESVRVVNTVFRNVSSARVLNKCFNINTSPIHNIKYQYLQFLGKMTFLLNTEHLY